MGKTFRPYQPEQLLVLPPSLQEWPADHLSYFVSDVVEELDLSAIYASYGEERGYPPYHPLLMTKLWLYAYAVGVRSSRKLMRATREDVALRVLCAGNEPDFRTLSEFRRRHLGGGHREGPTDRGASHQELGEWVEEWAARAPSGPSGEFAYSDFNYGALGYIVEEVSCMSIDRFTEERIIVPLDLEDTSTGFSDDPSVAHVWEEAERLHVRYGPEGSESGLRYDLVPLGQDRFALGHHHEDGRVSVSLDPPSAFGSSWKPARPGRSSCGRAGR